MCVSFNPIKCEKALAERGLDFADAETVFKGVTLEVEDIQKSTVKHESSAMACSQGGWSSLGTRRAARFATYSV